MPMGWLTRVAPSTRVLFGYVFGVLGASQLLVIVFVGVGHVVNLVAAVGLVVVGTLHFILALIQVRSRGASKPTVLQATTAVVGESVVTSDYARVCDS